MAAATVPTSRRSAIALLVALLAAVGLLGATAAVGAPDVVVAAEAPARRSDDRRCARRVRRTRPGPRWRPASRGRWSVLDRGRCAAPPTAALPGPGVSRRGPPPSRRPR
jgi:hypothetical protein